MSAADITKGELIASGTTDHGFEWTIHRNPRPTALRTISAAIFGMAVGLSVGAVLAASASAPPRLPVAIGSLLFCLLGSIAYLRFAYFAFAALAVAVFLGLATDYPLWPLVAVFGVGALIQSHRNHKRAEGS